MHSIRSRLVEILAQVEDNVSGEWYWATATDSRGTKPLAVLLSLIAFFKFHIYPPIPPALEPQTFGLEYNPLSASLFFLVL